jgi:PAS domain S-box-containing protein
VAENDKKRDPTPTMGIYDENGLTALLLNGMDQPILIFSLDGSPRYANSAFMDYSGYTRPDMESLNFNSLFQPTPPHTPENLFQRAKKEHRIVTEADFTNKNQHVAPITLSLRNVKNRQIDLIMCVLNDASGRLQIENDLRESRRKLTTLMSNLPGMVYRCRNDRNWTMEFVSDGCEKLLGYTAEEITGNTFTYRDMMHPEDRDYIWNEVQKALERKESFRFVFRVKTASGDNKWILEQGVGVFSETGELQGLEGFITDVTEQKKLENQLYQENRQLRLKVNRSSFNLGNIVGQSDVMQQVYQQIIQASSSDASVIIYGESGTGKELVAKAIHDMSNRRDNPFITINCGAVPDTLIESEFFGYKKGAFSGASHDKPGSLDLADNGTLFLDEIGEINANMQVKLLRAIDGDGFTPVGGSKTKYPNVRIISATNRNLLQLVNEGKFRKDFFYRIHVVPIELPPLRKRKEDIPLLMTHFFKKYSKNGKGDQLPLNLVSQLQEYNWPGNVRELQNLVQRYITTRKIGMLESSPKPIESVSQNGELRGEIELTENLKTTLGAYEKQIIKSLLSKHNWHRGKVARELGIDYRTLLRKMTKFRVKQS